ncbi:MAG: hypothetical protein PUK66_03430, partial [Bacteroidales bacterium]|uniref:hypothetical protein n=1 Tax=Porphyromonas sp. TaxID=1924944 RepID=UPI002970944F
FISRTGFKSLLRVGEGTMSKSLDEIINSNIVDAYTPATISDRTLRNNNETSEVSFAVANDGTAVRIKFKMTALASSLPSIGGGLEPVAHVSITAGVVGVKVLATAWHEIINVLDSPATMYGSESGSGQVTHDSTIFLNKGTYTLRFLQEGHGLTTAKEISVHQFWSSGTSFNAISEKGMRVFGSGTKFFNIDYSEANNTNAIATIRGGLNVDYIETSGAVLCGGQVNASGVVQASFGKYRNRSGNYTGPVVEKLGSGTSCYFRVHHSIGSTNYIPYVTPVNVMYSDLPQIVSKSYNYFDVRFYNGSGQSFHYAFNYMCFKAD